MTERVDFQVLTIDGWQQESVDPRSALDRLSGLIAAEEPRIHALVQEENRFERLDRELEAASQGPLARVPIGIKDIIHVNGLETRAGSQLPCSELEGEEAESVGRLKKAGAVILGKTVSTEFAYFAPGPTRNPHALEHTPGGSSSGSAAAVAAGYCPLALGTQTIGSVSRPASFCGVVGYKPTYGRISVAGVIPLAPSLDHVGVFASTVADADTAAAVLCTDWVARQPESRPRLGIPRGPYLERATDVGLDYFGGLCSRLRSMGWEMKSVDLFQDFSAIEHRHQLILAAEVARVHDTWFPRFGELYDPKTRELIERGQRIPEDVLAQELAAQADFQETLDRQSAEAGVDLWLSPAATGPAPRGLDSTGDPVMNLPWTQAGMPTLSLPAGTVEPGLPVGLQVTGRISTDELLLAWGRQLEADLESLS